MDDRIHHSLYTWGSSVRQNWVSILAPKPDSSETDVQLEWFLFKCKYMLGSTLAEQLSLQHLVGYRRDGHHPHVFSTHLAAGVVGETGERAWVRMESSRVFACGAGRSPPGSEVAQRRECAWERVGVPLERVDHRGSVEGWSCRSFALGVSNRRMFHQRDSMHQARGGEWATRGAETPLGAEPRLLRWDCRGVEDGGRVRADRRVALVVRRWREACGLQR